MTPAERAVRAAIAAAGGRLPFSAYMDAVLYGDGGFYMATAQRAATRRGDFVTSPELGGLFAGCVAAALRGWESVAVADYGGARGTLARALQAALPDARVGVVEGPDVMLEAARAAGLDAARSLDALGFEADTVVANELLDNLPSDLVTLDGTAVEVVVADGGLRLDPGVQTGVVPVPVAALDWLAALTALRSVRHLLLVDYGAPAADLAARPDLPVRAYRGHRRAGIFDAPGTADVTCEVPVDVMTSALQASGWRVDVTSQADWLRRCGIESAAARLREAEIAAAARQDVMAQLRARSDRSHAAALLDPAGLGAFVVIEAHRGA